MYIYLIYLLSKMTCFSCRLQLLHLYHAWVPYAIGAHSDLGRPDGRSAGRDTYVHRASVQQLDPGADVLRIQLIACRQSRPEPGASILTGRSNPRGSVRLLMAPLNAWANAGLTEAGATGLARVSLEIRPCVRDL